MSVQTEQFVDFWHKKYKHPGDKYYLSVGYGARHTWEQFEIYIYFFLRKEKSEAAVEINVAGSGPSDPRDPTLQFVTVR